MKYIITIVSLLIFSNLNAQERLSSIVYNQKTTQYIREVEGKHYLLSISHNNEVSVYEIQDADNVKFLHYTSIDGLNKKMFSFIGNYLVASSGLFPTAYNFVTNATLSIPTYALYPEFLGWQVATNNTGIYRASSLGGGIYQDVFFKSPDDRKVLPTDYKYLAIYDNILFCRPRKNSSTNTFSLFDIDNQKSTVLVEGTTKTHEFTVIGNKGYYVNKDNALVEYDLKSGLTKDYGLQSEYNGTKVAALVQNGKAYIYNSIQDTSYIEVYDTATKTKITEYLFLLRGAMEGNLWKVINGKIILQGKSKELVIIDEANDGNLYRYNLAQNFKFITWPIASERYFIVPYGKTIKVVDLFTMNEVTSTINVEAENIIDITFFPDKVGKGSFLFQFKDPSEDNTFRINDDLTIYSFPQFVNEPLSLSTETAVLSINNQIYGCDSVFYSIDDTKVERINENQAINAPLTHYKVIGNKIYYSKNTSTGLEIYFIEDNKENFVTNLGSSYGPSVSDIKETSKGLYFLFLSGKFVYYDYDTKTKTALAGNAAGFNILIDLLQFGDEIIFANNDVVNKIDSNGKITTFNLYTDFFSQGLVFHDKLYINTDGKIYIYENGKFSLIYNTMNPGEWLDFSDNYLFFNDFSGPRTIDVNGIVDEHVIKGNTESIYRKSVNEHYTVMGQLNNKSAFIFDNRLGQYLDFKPDQYLKNWLVVTIIDNDTLALIYEDNAVVSYLVKNNFQNLEEKDRFTLPTVNYITLENFDDMMVVFFETDMFILNRDGKLIRVSSNRKNITNKSVVRQGDYIYYIGVDDVFGRQFFRYNLGGVNATAEVIGKNSYLAYPNPTSNVLNIAGLSLESMPCKYTLYNSLGNHKGSGLIQNNTIDVSNLQSGFYEVVVQPKNQKTFTLTFSKI